MRRHRTFRTAWVFGYAGGEGKPGKGYHLVVLMDPPNHVVFHDLSLVIRAVRRGVDDVQVGLLDGSDTAAVAMAFRQARCAAYSAGGLPRRPMQPTRNKRKHLRIRPEDQRLVEEWRPRVS